VEADVIVLDAQMPALPALEALKAIRSDLPDSRILVFSAPESEEFGLLCMSLGASGYLSKDIDLASMPRILLRLGEGEAVFSRRFGTSLVSRLREREHRKMPAVSGPISAPERQLLELIKAGQGLEQAADQLGVSAATVRRHLASARRKLLTRAPVRERALVRRTVAERT
jgi:DNA-binding NarL/FixJ family response regulator